MRPFIYTPPSFTSLPILHQDDDLLVLTKPSGLLTVPGKAEEHYDCLESRVQQKFPKARIVHRLDMDTSGIIVMALNANAHRHLGLQFEKRLTKKTYIARVWGVITGDEGEVDLPLCCDWPNRPKQMVDHKLGRKALTKWRVLNREDKITRVELTPVTGRSHQLRIHMLELGHPILGDNLYAHEQAYQAADRLQLHSYSLEFRHPTGGKYYTFVSDPEF